MYYKRIYLILVSGLLCIGAAAQTFGVSTNALGWGALTPNIGLDVGLAKHFTFEVEAGANPFKFSDNRSSRFWAVQPEFKYWFREKFNGPSVGLHGTYGSYDFGLRKYVYRGTMYGGGLSLNYAWMLGERWNLEASLGGGCTRLDRSDKLLRQDPLSRFGPSVTDKWGLTRAGITFTHFFGKVNASRSSVLAARAKRASGRRWARLDYEDIRAAVRDGINEVAASRKDTVLIIREVPATSQAPEYEEIPDQRTFEIRFNQGSDKPNSAHLADILTHLYDGSVISRDIRLVASCSPEGGEKLNEDLAQRRADWVLGRLRDAGIPSGNIDILAKGTDWDTFVKLVSEAPLTRLEEILDILHSEKDHDTSLDRIRQVSPEDWKVIAESIFPKMRNVTLVVDSVRKIKK